MGGGKVENITVIDTIACVAQKMNILGNLVDSIFNRKCVVIGIRTFCPKAGDIKPGMQRFTCKVHVFTPLNDYYGMAPNGRVQRRRHQVGKAVGSPPGFKIAPISLVVAQRRCNAVDDGPLGFMTPIRSFLGPLHWMERAFQSTHKKAMHVDLSE
jgi:hypothetical protein